MTDIEFKVGQEHENMKGVYKVLAVDRDTLCICWESGEEVTTTVALQNRIIERMQRERALIRGKKGGKSKKPRLSEYVSKFEGLKEDDFSEDVAGATWRHYDSLGGAVAVRLNSDKFDIASWPRYGLSAIYWGDFDHRCQNDFSLQAKFFARLDESRLYFGFCVERSDQEEDTKKDLTTTEVKKILTKIKKLGIKRFVLSGGEPFLRQDIIQLIKHGRKKGLEILVNTNGSIITEEQIKQCHGDVEGHPCSDKK